MINDDAPSQPRRELIKTAALAGVAAAFARPSVLAAQSAGEATMQAAGPFRLFDSQTLPPSPGFSQVAEIAPGRLVYISGQVPRNAAGDLVGPGDFRVQLEQVFSNLDAAVRAAGGTFADVVKLNYYCVASIEPEQQRHIVEVRDRYVNLQAPPVSTFVFVSRLVRPEWLIEIEAVAVLPAASTVVVLAQLDFASNDQMQKAIELAREATVRTRAEQGCLHYAFAADLTIATRLQLSEWWRDEASLMAHLRTSHLQQFRSGLRQLGGVKSTVTRYDVGRIGELTLPPLDGR